MPAFEFTWTTCCACGVAVGMPGDFERQRRADGAKFFCLNGHPLSWRETENDKIRRERDRLKQQLARRDELLETVNAARVMAERQSRARKGVITKMTKRAKAGVCMCCNRTFSELAKHMASEHPDFKAEEITDGAVEEVRPA